ncbi:alpha,alpha-trehalase [Aestuariibaculum lutulentum]|uniref:Alpha,alpha-trehalase n=1 Tax=Aestuariibaculum lutulentum TaxID=2920935 RepID=A0ABS9RLT8_9FLAO|nr:alpha,alpha-trehalase [Aestuariibaculum lutulentum]MCH4553904.1 alpha,alpha-trehalase [Aestuariibaculum lutulentum]
MKLFVNKTKLIDQLLKQEDTTGSYTITVDDNGKKSFKIQTDKGNDIIIKGTYHLSNLLQEAALLKSETGIIEIKHVKEEPVSRLSRIIKDFYWDKLTRNFDKGNLLKILEDEKMKGEFLRLYVPETDKDAFEFHKKNATEFKNVKIETIPENISKELITALNKKPGILSLAYSREKGLSIPFVVPGGRFNEMYGWDSYFIGLGLIIDDKFELAQAMIDNLEYQIIHYGKILNANRSYYLSRSQPPFFTSFLKTFYETYKNRITINWLTQKINTSLIEYFNVWMTEGIRLTPNGLNRYFGEGTGAPSETEQGHFDAIYKIFAKKHRLSLTEFKKQYKTGKVIDQDLDMYFIHDRSMRESGHDTTTRLDNCSADLNTVDLNSLLFKYENDIAYFIKTYFNDAFSYNGKIYSSKDWFEKANNRKALMIHFMWNDKNKCFYDYNYKNKRQQPFNSATNLYPLWSQLCSTQQAKDLVKGQLATFTYKGGIASTGLIKNLSKNMPNRQWDYPYGWAPHQMLIWEGLNNYGFINESQELIYRWLWLIVKTAVEYNGLIPEKFNVNTCTHKVNVEYGNVGTNFKYIPDGGFGWTNASYKMGIKHLNSKYIKHLNELVDPDIVFKK